MLAFAGNSVYQEDDNIYASRIHGDNASYYLFNHDMDLHPMLRTEMCNYGLQIEPE